MLYGSHGMLGAMLGAGGGAIFTDDPDDVNQNAAMWAGIGGIAGTMPKPAIAWAGLNMRNFSSGYYDQDPIKGMTKLEELAGNKFTSIKRNLSSAVRGKGQQMGYNNTVLNAINNSNIDDAEAIYKKIKNPTQFEDLQMEMRRNKMNGTAVDEFKNYRTQFGGVNSTPEEAIWHMRRDNARRTNAGIDGKISNIEAEMLENDARLKGGDSKKPRLSPEGHFQRNSKLYEERQGLKRKYQRYGEADRKWRHEIAKNESHAMWANKEWSKERLATSGYKHQGAYRWGDVKQWMSSAGGPQWEYDINKYADKITARMGLGKGMMLNNNTPVNLLSNVHSFDMRIKRGPSRVFQKMGRHASTLAFNHPQMGMKDIQNSIMQLHNQGKYRFKWRDLRDYGESWKNDTVMNKFKDTKAMRLLRRDLKHPLTPLPKIVRDKAPKGLIRYNDYMREYMGLNKYQRRYSERGRFLFQKMSDVYASKEARKIASQMKTQGAFKGATRGQFQLSGIGRVTNSYLEGGINATATYKPFIEPGSRATKVAQRLITSDLSDLPMSGHTGVQRNIPFIVEEEFRTYDGKSGKEISKNMTRANPFFGDEKRINELVDPVKGKKLTRGDVKHYIAKKGMSRDSMRYLKRKVSENPKSFLKYAARRVPGLALGYGIPVGLLAWHFLGQKDGENELNEII